MENWYKKAQQEISNEGRKVVYHGTSEEFDRFDLDRSADGTIWFTDNINKIRGGVSGASRFNVIIECIIDESQLKLAGWGEDDRYSTGELIGLGYDGLKLISSDEITYRLYDPNNVEIIRVIEAKKNNWYKTAQVPVKATDSTEFKAWFGNSKVVDENEDPLKVYHGTNQEFTFFDESRLGENTHAVSSIAFFFTESTDEASAYADVAGRTQIQNAVDVEKKAKEFKKQTEEAEARGDWDKYERSMEEWENLEYGAINADPAGQNVISVYLKIENPVILDIKDSFNAYRVADVINESKENGNDGLKLINVFDKVGDSQDTLSTTQWVAFSPNQIKSATGNKGTFSSDDPNIISKTKTNLYKQAQNNQYSFLGVCDKIRGDIDSESDLKCHKMMNNAVPVSIEEFLNNCDMSKILDEDESIEEYIESNSDIKFLKSNFGKLNCYFFQTAGFEFIWTEGTIMASKTNWYKQAISFAELSRKEKDKIIKEKQKDYYKNDFTNVFDGTVGKHIDGTNIQEIIEERNAFVSDFFKSHYGPESQDIEDNVPEFIQRYRGKHLIQPGSIMGATSKKENNIIKTAREEIDLKSIRDKDGNKNYLMSLGEGRTYVSAFIHDWQLNNDEEYYRIEEKLRNLYEIKKEEVKEELKKEFEYEKKQEINQPDIFENNNITFY